MSNLVIPATAPPLCATEAEIVPRPPRFRRARAFFGIIWRLMCGMFGCLSPLGALFVIGWTQRAAQRRAVRHWHSVAFPKSTRDRYHEFLEGDTETRDLKGLPRWIAGSEPTGRAEASVLRRGWDLIRRNTQSLRRNFWLGVQGAFNTSVFTLPACVLWWFAWYDGWQNSFNKGYEQAFVGPMVSLIGIFLFIGAMYYVPMAQARQAVTGNWKAYYDFRLIWNVVRHRWLSCAFLAGCYVAASIPATILKTSPMFWSQDKGIWENATDAEVLHALNRYFFWCALYFFPVFTALRMIAARIYASAVVEGLADGWICHESLSGFESKILQRLNLVYPKPPRHRHPVLRAAAWAGTRIGRVSTYVALFFVWFAFVAQIYISEFLKTNSGLGWLNQPLVQLPWFRYVPTRLDNPLMQIFLAALVVAGAGVIRKIYMKLVASPLFSRRSKTATAAA